LQDTEDDEAGNPKIRQGVAKDRIISTSDAEMRHGRKSASRKFDGYKMDVMTDEASELVLGVEIRSGNAGDGEGAAPLLEQVQAVDGIEVETLLGDMAYSDGDTRVAVEELGTELVAKVPPVTNRGLFPKTDFVIDLQASTATCPAGKVVYGTGWQIEGARGQVMVDHVIPTKTSVSVSAYEIDGGITSGYSGNWSLKAIARCGADPGGRQIVTANTPQTSDNKLGLVDCPSGKVPLGGGFEVHGLRDRILVNNLIITNLNVQTAAYELIDVSPGTWYIETYAVCVNP